MISMMILMMMGAVMVDAYYLGDGEGFYDSLLRRGVTEQYISH
jgi:CO dehydrogenase/acetyl-CoA synthase epsilon subunit